MNLDGDKTNTDDIKCLKQKLRNICLSERFCGICLEIDGKLWNIDSEFDITVGLQTQQKLLKDMISYILNNKDYHVLASTYLCTHCIEKSIQCYLFIYNAVQLSNIIFKCVSELHSKSIDVYDQLGQINNYENSCVAIVLEQESEISEYTDIGKMTEIIVKETPKMKTVENKQIKTVSSVDIQTIKSNYDDSNSHKNIKAVTVENIEDVFKYNIKDVENATIKPELTKNLYIKPNVTGKVEKLEEHNVRYLDETHLLELVENNENVEILFTDETAVDTADHVTDVEIEIFNIPEDSPNKTASLTLKKKKRLKSLTYKCRRCREVLPSHKSWKIHDRACKKIKIKSSKNIFKCKICSEILNTQRSLSKHYKIHSKIKCKVCHFMIPLEDRVEHMKINHEDYIHKCNLCSFFSFTADRLKLHMDRSHSGSKCALCFKKVSKNELKTHKCRYNCLECVENICIHYKYLVSYREQVLNNESKFKCVDCGFICPRREALLGHVNREHLDHHPFTCAHCSQQFYSRTTLRHHLNQFHKQRHICEFCDQEFNSISLLDNHVETCKTIVREHRCDLCTTSFDTLKDLASHVRLRHDNEALDCELCERKFLTSSKLQDHVFKVHSGLQMKRKKSILDCPVCDEKVDNKRQLMQHIEIHGPDAKFPCKDCEAVFDNIKKLHAHVRVHYNDVIECVHCKKILTATFFPYHMVYCKPGREEGDIYTCEVCGKTFNTELQIRLHSKIHIAKVPCPICQKPTKPIYLKNHIKYMHSKPKKAKKEPKLKVKHYIKCDYCDHRVSRHGELEAHVNRFHLQVKPYQCAHCQKTFFGKERLRDHLITHTTHRTCFCTVCGQKFENKSCLKLHMRRHTGYSPYACDICGDKFRTSSIMNTHKVKKHSQRTVSCPLCGAMFHLIREMRSHFKKVHWKQKGKKFDPRDVKELHPAFYHLFEDGRLPKIEGEELYISSKFNEKFD